LWWNDTFESICGRISEPYAWLLTSASLIIAYWTVTFVLLLATESTSSSDHDADTWSRIRFVPSPLPANVIESSLSPMPLRNERWRTMTFCVVLPLLLVIWVELPYSVIGDGAVWPAMYRPLTFLMSRLAVSWIVPPTSNTMTRPAAGNPLSRTPYRSVPGVSVSARLVT
jgi:hypothetical protein